MTEEGLHLDVAGGGEILTALKAGADPARLVLHGNAKTDEELEMAVKYGVGLVVVDNFDDIDLVERIVPAGRQQPCLVRVIPGVEAATHASQATGHAGSKFGLMPDDARAAIARIERSLRCGSTACTLTSDHNCQRRTAGCRGRTIAKLGTFDVYDLGGGLGVRYTYDEHLPSLDAYAEAMTARPERCCPPPAASSSSQAAAWSRPAPAPSTASRRSSAASSPMSRWTAAWATTSRCR